MHRVVVTGMGLTTALGADLPAVWRRLIAGDNGIGPIRVFDASEYSCKVAAEIPYGYSDESGCPRHQELPFDETGLQSVKIEHCRRGVQLFLKAAREAYADATLGECDLQPHAVGVAAGASVNFVNNSWLREYHRCRNGNPRLPDLTRVRNEGRIPVSGFLEKQGDLMAAVAAKRFGFMGPAITIDTACASSAHAIGQAFRLIRRGKAQAVLAGGASGLVGPLTILAFAVLGALSRNEDPATASRPFDRRRDGFVMGEAGGVVVLENYDHARARGAKIYAELAGFGSTTNAHSLTDPSPDGVAEQAAMRLALEDAQLRPEEIGYVAAHGTSTPKNDVTETQAIKRLFGGHAKKLLVSSNKGQLGHTISAAGVCNFIFAIKAIQDGCVPPTMHYRNPDPECDLDYVPNACRTAPVRAALANAFAFAGQNAILAVKAYPEA